MTTLGGSEQALACRAKSFQQRCSESARTLPRYDIGVVHTAPLRFCREARRDLRAACWHLVKQEERVPQVWTSLHCKLTTEKTQFDEPKQAADGGECRPKKSLSLSASASATGSSRAWRKCRVICVPWGSTVHAADPAGGSLRGWHARSAKQGSKPVALGPSPAWTTGGGLTKVLYIQEL